MIRNQLFILFIPYPCLLLQFNPFNPIFYLLFHRLSQPILIHPRNPPPHAPSPPPPHSHSPDGIIAGQFDEGFEIGQGGNLCWQYQRLHAGLIG